MNVIYDEYKKVTWPCLNCFHLDISSNTCDKEKCIYPRAYCASKEQHTEIKNDSKGMEDRRIPKQLSVPPMSQIKFGDVKADVTIDSLIRMLEICKQEVGGEELVLFRDEDDNIFMPEYPTIAIENTYDPINGGWLCHRIFIDVRKG